MRQSQNKCRFYWLPLLCLIWTAPASAQWTTVWTPDSALAAKATTKAGTHESKTNCYPCKEWEDYGDNKGRWVDYPTNTSPRICPDDETDYTCKMCDGNGGVTNATDYTSCGTCRCCEGGECIHYPDNCPNPPPTPSVSFVKVGPCPCTDPTALACVVPASYPIPMPGVTVCLQNCIWIPIVDSITLKYFEGLCPNNCRNTIQSATDVNEGNYCAVSNAIQNRINNISPNAPPPTGAPTTADYCFAECLQAHEDIHVEQLRPEWDLLWNLIRDDITHISVPFDCKTARTESQARAAMLHDVALIMLNHYPTFLYAWELPDRGEADAYQAETECLQDLATQIEQMAAANGWTCP
jgi:hypothetical protein